MSTTPAAAEPVEEVDITRDTDVRYAGYVGRAARLLSSSSRYLAFVSDVGEAFRPVVSPSVVRASYGVSWAYVVADVAYHTQKAQKRGDDPIRECVKSSAFQLVASIGLPMVIIHTQVAMAAKLFARVGRFQKYGPTVAGLALLPALPVVCDEPVEHLTEVLFDKFWPTGKPHDAHPKHE